MPFFDQNPLAALGLATADTDSMLDLRGLAQDEAMQRVESVLAGPGQDGNSYLIRFDPAAPGGSETLFLPLGRRLLAARRAGRLTRCMPLADGAAYYIVLSTGSES